MLSWAPPLFISLSSAIVVASAQQREKRRETTTRHTRRFSVRTTTTTATAAATLDGLRRPTSDATSRPRSSPDLRPTAAATPSTIHTILQIPPALRRFSDAALRRKTDLMDGKEFYDLSSAEEDNNELHVPGRSSRSASVTSISSAMHELTLNVPTSNSAATSPTPSVGQRSTCSATFNMSMFDPESRLNRTQPPLPDSAGIEYPRAASWASGTCVNVLNDEKGRALFRCFLFQSLADENLSFIEAVEKLKKAKGADEKRDLASEILETYSPFINLSSAAMKKMRDAADSDNPDPEEFQPAIKEVRRLLENDQFPRFRRSEVYLEFLEQLLPRSYAEKWAHSFEALLGNHVGRHHFRLFLRGIHAEENLRFWEAVVEYRAVKNKSNAMYNLGKVILNTYLTEGTVNEVFLPFGVRQVIERRLTDKEIDITLFDEAIKHVEQVLRNDPYVRFLQSEQYAEILGKLQN